MDKSIKKISKILIIFLLVVLAVLATAFFILQNGKVQTFITRQIALEFSKNVDAKIEVESVNFRFFNRVVLKNVYIEDHLQDTLLFSKEIICNLSRFDRKKHVVDFSNINLVNARIFLHKYDTLQPLNIRLRSTDIRSTADTIKENQKWNVSFQNIEMHQSVLKYKSVRIKEVPDGVVNFNNLYCYIDDLEVRDFNIENNIVTFYTKKLKFREKTGFYVHNMKFNASIGKNHMIFKNVKIRTPYSFIDSDSLVFRHNDYNDYQQFAKNIYLDFTLQESNISFNDVGYFTQVFKNISVNTVISGRTYNKLSNFKGKDVKFHIGEGTELITDFNLSGLPNHEQMFMYVDFKKLTTSAQDFEIINDFFKRSQKIDVPESFDKLGTINYKGNFAGFYDDFVTYGKFTSDLGNISTDLSLRPDTSKTLAFSGNIKTNNFNVGELVGDKNLVGKISVDAQINGSTSKNKTINAITAGTVHNIEINDYNYQNIIIDGELTEKTYNGFLNISDPNIKLDFTGEIDFSEEIPTFNFTADVPYANLYGLNIDNTDTTATLSFKLDANFKGIDVDEAIGTANFSNAQLVKLNTEMNFDTLKLISEQIADTQRIELQSDYIDALLTGSYTSTSLIQSAKNLFYNYLPALIRAPADTTALDFDNNLAFDVSLKNTSLISKFFLPDIYLSDSSKLTFKYNSKEKTLFLKAATDQLSYKKHVFNKLNVNTFSSDSIFTVMTRCNSFLLNNSFTFENFKTTSITHGNNIDFKVDWNNLDTVDYKGKIIASTQISQKKPFDDPSFMITILPSKIVVQDSVWQINKSQVKIDTTSLYFNKFKINHGNQSFVVDGKVSENPEDTLFFEFKNLNMAHVNIITAKNKLKFDGTINGKANFSRIFNNPLFYSDLEINNLMLNEEAFGYTQIHSRWIEENEAIQVEASTLNNNTRTINVSGNYYPEKQDIMFNVILNKLELSVLDPYLSSFASNLSGVTDGSVLVTGKLTKPEFNGNLYVQNAALTIDYLKTRYNFTSEVSVENNKLIFPEVNSTDIYGNTALTNGFVKFGPKKNINFDFNINANSVHSLSTNGSDNQAFYGSAFMSGIVKITGDREYTDIDISGITEKNTRINIPLTKFQGENEVNFVTFTNQKYTEPATQPELTADYSDFGLNFDLEITPEAEALLIFDSKIGDIIRGNGEGNIKMEINDDNDFNMYGDYVIEEGEYLFTLQDVINKKFKIKRGGSITWNGEPYDANIDIEAVYPVKTSLSSLIAIEDTTGYFNAEDYQRRIPVECQVFLTGRLMNPNIRFDINLPTADEEAKTLVESATDTEEKLNKQFLSLLVLNSFMREQTGAESGFNDNSNTAGLGTVTTSELLSNQLSHWLSQISDEWDVGVNYRPGDEISKDQVEVALSTQILDDRVSINGNVGYGGQTVEEASNIVGDFNIDVKLNKSGKLRLKAFNESNDKLLYEDSPYTQGVGVFYREEFNSFSELMKKIWLKISGKKKKEKSE